MHNADDIQPRVLTFEVPPDKADMRLDKYISEVCDLFTRSAVVKMMEDGGVQVDGMPAGKNYKVKTGNKIVLTVPELKVLETRPQNIPLSIVYEDEDLLVVNKPKGMVVHPAAGNYENTLVNALLYHCGASLSGINGVIRPGIVHRIDKDTSGLLIVAKNDFAHLALAQQIKAHSFHRAYEAVVYGNIKKDGDTICQPIGRNPKERKKMAVTMKNSKNAVTHYTVLERFGDFTHVRCELETGRTHQIRVHMAYIGHPLAGDAVYGPKKAIQALHGQCLHAREIGFVHPRTGNWMTFTSALPDYFITFLNKLRK